MPPSRARHTTSTDVSCREKVAPVSGTKLHTQKENCGNLRQPQWLRLVLANLSRHRPTQRPKSEARERQPPGNGFALTVP